MENNEDQSTAKMEDKRFLRGEAHHSFKTKCSKGHPFEGDNLKIASNGQRRCAICIKIARENVYKRQKLKRRMMNEEGL